MTVEPKRVGLECPQCGCRHFRVGYTRPRRGHILRRRICRHCGRVILTREQVVGSRVTPV